MILKSISFENFKSFVGKHEFDFLGGKPGLYFISGENKVNSSLGSNGSGKSTLIDVFKWVITGKTVRNLKAGDVHSRDIKGGTSAELTLEINNSEYKIYRAWSPNKLTISKDGEVPVTVQQETVDKLIGLSEDDMMNSIIYGQFNSSFLDMQPSQMLAVFSGILDLEYWTDKSDKASKEKTKTQTELTSIESRLSYSNGKIEQLQISYKSSKELSSKFDEDKDRKLSSLEEEHSRLLIEFDNLPIEKEYLASNLTELTDRISEIREVINEIKSEESDIKGRVLLEESNLKREMLAYERIQKLGPRCSTCEQEISGEHKSGEIHKYDDSIKSLQGKIQGLTRSRSEIVIELNEALELLKSVEFQIEHERSTERLILSENSDLKRKKSLIESKLDSLESEFKRVNDSLNPYMKKASDTKEELESELTAILEKKSKIEEFKKKVSAYETWVKGFKEIRLLVIEQAILDLEVEVNNAISELGLEGWSIHFDIEKENKSGGISKGFSVFVHSPNNDATVPWVSWSGGEGQRLRLAASAGLSSLILGRRNVNPNVEFYDEPSKHLSEEGLMDLANYLSNRAQTLGKQIWLVDHNIPNFSGISGSVKIVKDSKGSSIEYA